MSSSKISVGLCMVFGSLWFTKADAQVSYKKTYWGNTVESSFSSALFSKPGKDESLSTLRVSNVFNVALTLNHDFSNVVGIYTGIGIRNIGFTEKYKAADSTVKRRVYCLEVPAGIKIGSMYRRRYIVLGGGADFAFNYKEKGYVRRGNKDKFNEWLSDRTEIIMPFVFAGVSFNPGLVFRVQYYPQNFLKPGFTDDNGVKPYAGYNTNLLMLNIGIDIHHHNPPGKELQGAKGMVQ